MSHPPVLVVGAGPVGLALASGLLRSGVDVRLVDKLAQPSPYSRAVAVHARSLELLRSFGVADRLVERGARVDGAAFEARGKTLAEVGFAGVESVFPFILCVAQDETERVLTELVAELGGGVEREVELVGLEQHDDGVTASLRHADGSTENLGCSYVCGCDGSKSTVRRLVGARLEGSFHGEHAVLADCDLDGDLARDRLTAVAHRDGSWMAFPLPGQRCRLVIGLRDAPADGAEPTLEEIQAMTTDRVGRDLRLTHPRWLAYFEVRHGQVPHYRANRVFLSGDAAHIHSPAGGQGMNTGMQDAYNLAWKLALAWRSVSGPKLLDSYHAERHPVGASVIRLSTTMTKVASVDNPVARGLQPLLASFLLGRPAVSDRVAGSLAEMDIAYHRSPIVGGVARRTAGHGALRPGDLAPDVAGLGGGDSEQTSLADAFDPVAHTAVLVASDGEIEPGAETARTLRANFGTNVRTVLVAEEEREGGSFDRALADPAGAVAARYGAGESLLAIVRPDRYLGFLGEAEDVRQAEDVLVRTIV